MANEAKIEAALQNAQDRIAELNSPTAQEGESEPPFDVKEFRADFDQKHCEAFLREMGEFGPELVSQAKPQDEPKRPEPLIEAVQFLEAYHLKHQMGVKEVIQSEWVRGVFAGRKEAINILTEEITRREKAANHE